MSAPPHLMLARRWWSRGAPYSVQQAVAATLQSDRDGQVERVAEAVESTAEFLARLVEVLHANGHLSVGDVLHLLPGFKEEHAEDEA